MAVTHTPGDLQKSAEKLVGEMEELIGGAQNPAFNTHLAMQALHKFACLLAVISIVADKQSRRILRLTWALLVFTIALLLFTIFLYRDTHVLVQHEQPTQPHTTEHQ